MFWGGSRRENIKSKWWSSFVIISQVLPGGRSFSIRRQQMSWIWRRDMLRRGPINRCTRYITWASANLMGNCLWHRDRIYIAKATNNAQDPLKTYQKLSEIIMIIKQRRLLNIRRISNKISHSHPHLKTCPWPRAMGSLTARRKYLRRPWWPHLAAPDKASWQQRNEKEAAYLHLE